MDHSISKKLKSAVGFEWDRGNSEKNWIKHLVTTVQCEQIFFNSPLIVAADATHSFLEERFFALGQTDEGRRLFVVFTLRQNLIRIISARDMSKKERGIYEKK